jgi:amidase
MINLADVTNLELVEVAELIRTRALSSVELTEAILDRIDRYDPVLKSHATVMADQAHSAATTADREIARGRYRGPLHGVPVAVKDLAYTADAPTGSGGTIHAGYMAGYDATVVARLRAAGAVLTGKLTMTEGAFTDHHDRLRTPINPWGADTWTGTSSSGSGVATAAGLTFGSLGSDTGGSIRFPSAMNGVTGVKPTWGRVSRYGIVHLAPSLDHIGPIARSAADCAVMLGAIAGADVNDPTASQRPVPDYVNDLRLRRVPRVGVNHELFATFDLATQEVLRATVARMEALGWSVMEVPLPDLRSVAADFTPLCSVETAAAHVDTYPERAEEYGAALAKLIDQGRAMSAIDYQVVLERRRAFTGQMEHVFEGVDLLLMPGMGAASPTNEWMSTFGADPDLFSSVVAPTAPFDICGVPTVTMPAGFTDRGTPIAVQLVAGAFEEGLMLQAAHALQQVTDFHRVHPDLEKLLASTAVTA